MRKIPPLITFAAIAVTFLTAGSSTAHASGPSIGGSSASITSNLSNVTSASLGIADYLQGTRDPSGGFLKNSVQGGLDITGTCAAGNSNCTQPPEIRITIQSSALCLNAGFPCYMVYSIINGNPSTLGYVAATGGLETWTDDGLFHPVPTEGSAPVPVTLGYCLSYQRINITQGGTCDSSNILGWFQTATWGQTVFGPITKETVYSQVYNYGGSWTGSMLPSMDFAFSNFTDSAGNHLPTPTVTPGNYTISGVSGTGWTVTGGQDPSEYGYWPIEASRDNGMCMTVSHGTFTAGNPVVVATCGNFNSIASWKYDANSQHIIIVNGNTNWCLWDPNVGGAGTQLEIQTCGTGNGEKFTTVSIPNGSSNGIGQWQELQAYSGNVCVQNPGNSQLDGTILTMASCTSNQAESWDPLQSLGA